MTNDETVERVVPGTESWDLYGLEHSQRYEFFSKQIKGKKVLDAACGTGYGSEILYRLGRAASVLGLDISKEAIEFCSKYSNAHVSFKHYDCSNLISLNEKFDVIISFETIEHLLNPEDFISQASQILSPGGVFICSTPNKFRLSGSGNINPYHPSELTFQEFESIFNKYFIISGSFHQSESVQYSRYLELRHMISKVGGRASSYFINRIENKLRNLFNKSFEYDPYLRPGLDNMHVGDMEILSLEHGPENWHKTFILQGIKK